MKKLKLTTRFIVTTAVCLVVVIAIIVGNCIAAYWGNALEQFFGLIGGSTPVTEGAFTSEYKSSDEVTKAAEDVCEEIENEGMVLLKNDNGALPLDVKTESKISLFGICSVNFYWGGTGSGAVTVDESMNLKQLFSDAKFSVNETLWNFYTSGAAKSYRHGRGSDTNGSADFALNEAPQTVYQSASIASSYSSYNDAAIIVIGRLGGEGADLPRTMVNYGGSADKHYLELTTEETDLIKAVKAAGFKKTILVVATGNAMELGDLDALGVDACLWVGYCGSTGMKSIVNAIRGEVNPSGKTVDVYARDNLAAPAVVNMGDFEYSNSTSYHYVTYSEGIYVGYRYYETRYEDVIMERGSAGEFDYDTEVVYPFGYGLSYTDFTWDKLELTEKDGAYTASVKVTNTGDRAGKDVVELYYQSPYTAYDIEKGVEKSAVELLGFAKTGLIEPNGSETVEITFTLEDMKSYDVHGHGGYILEPTGTDGNYYVTAATDSHQAINNILAAKGYGVSCAEEMTEEIEVPELVLYKTEKTTGATVGNLFGFADLTDKDCVAYDSTFKYLTRNDWTGTMPAAYATGTADKASDNAGGKKLTMEASDELISALSARGYDAARNPKKQSEYTMPTTGKNTGLTLADFTKVAYDGKAVTADGTEHAWSELLDTMSADDYKALMSAGYSTAKISSIGKLKTKELDGPAGISAFVGKLNCTAYPVEVVLASTWNVELAQKMGASVGEEAIWAGVNGWYAPAMNIHRNAFAGRNYEYYSEDPLISGNMAAAVVSAAQQKGLYCFIKHFAVNDQETHRSITGNVVWLNEQTMREIYLEPFRLAIVGNPNGNQTAVMTAFNRIGPVWSGGCYELVTGVLRTEWGVNGFVITDYYGGPYMDTNQLLAAGGDALLTNGKAAIADTSSAATVSLMREASHRILATVANSNFMNASAEDTVEGFPVYILLLIILDVGVAAGVTLFEVFAVRNMLGKKKDETVTESENERQS